LLIERLALKLSLGSKLRRVSLCGSTSVDFSSLMRLLRHCMSHGAWLVIDHVDLNIDAHVKFLNDALVILSDEHGRTVKSRAVSDKPSSKDDGNGDVNETFRLWILASRHGDGMIYQNPIVSMLLSRCAFINCPPFSSNKYSPDIEYEFEKRKLEVIRFLEGESF
jgi:hypothetical protein